MACLEICLVSTELSLAFRKIGVNTEILSEVCDNGSEKKAERVIFHTFTGSKRSITLMCFQLCPQFIFIIKISFAVFWALFTLFLFIYTSIQTN